MARSGLISDTIDSLRVYLEANVRLSDPTRVRIETRCPTGASPPRALPCLSLFLYRLAENRALFLPDRSLEGPPEPSEEGIALYRNPPRYFDLDCAALAWGRTPSEEHEFLGGVLVALMDVPELRYSQGLEGGSFRDGDRIGLRFTPSFDLAGQQEILRSLHVPFRPLLSFSATVRLDSERIEEVRTVQQRVTRVIERTA